MQAYGTFEKIETVYLGLCIPNVNYINEPKDWVYIYDQCFCLRKLCQSQINLLLRATTSYCRGSFLSRALYTGYRITLTNVEVNILWVIVINLVTAFKNHTALLPIWGMKKSSLLRYLGALSPSYQALFLSAQRFVPTSICCWQYQDLFVAEKASVPGTISRIMFLPVATRLFSCQHHNLFLPASVRGTAYRGLFVTVTSVIRISGQEPL